MDGRSSEARTAGSSRCRTIRRPCVPMANPMRPSVSGRRREPEARMRGPGPAGAGAGGEEARARTCGRDDRARRAIAEEHARDEVRAREVLADEGQGAELAG